jgi:hypothetical protein
LLASKAIFKEEALEATRAGAKAAAPMREARTRKAFMLYMVGFVCMIEYELESRIFTSGNLTGSTS